MADGPYTTGRRSIMHGGRAAPDRSHAPCKGTAGPQQSRAARRAARRPHQLPASSVRAVSRPTSSQWGSIRCCPLICTYGTAHPHVGPAATVRVGELANSRKIPTREFLPLFALFYGFYRSLHLSVGRATRVLGSGTRGGRAYASRAV
jgi:hypothetical protein